MGTKLLETPAPLAVGDILIGREGPVTPKQLVDYGSGFLSSAIGRPVVVGANIHTDVEAAKKSGLEAPIVDGMLSTNYLSNMMTRYFGRAYVENGSLRTKFIKPIPALMDIKVRGKVVRKTMQPTGAMRYTLDVWVEDPDGNMLVVGDATVDTP
ncbi:MAG: MaoC family dehydratase [Propionibacteriaceae bacterium]|nr:MaoC family dehydratase [Propionibacteriaceae bacterium]